MAADLNFQELMSSYNLAQSRLLLLDYDGTLMPFEDRPERAIPNDHIKHMVKQLVDDPLNDVILISGRDSQFLEAVWTGIPIHLAAEHGGYYKNPGSQWNETFPADNNWIPSVAPSIQALVNHFEGSIMERKSFSIAWHYRAIANQISKEDLHGILEALAILPSKDKFQVYIDNLTIELRTPIVNKGAFATRWIGERDFDFILAIGDGQTDEDLFTIFTKDSFTIKVGSDIHTRANYVLHRQEDVIPLLENMLSANQQFTRAMNRVGLVE